MDEPVLTSSMFTSISIGTGTSMMSASSMTVESAAFTCTGSTWCDMCTSVCIPEETSIVSTLAMVPPASLFAGASIDSLSFCC